MRKFELGQVVTTKGIYEESVANKKFFHFVSTCLGRYMVCDWGNTPDEDAKRNDDAIKNGERIFASYVGVGGKTIWIITEHDRSATTILFPSEY